jgi:hypothetical protein
MALMFIVEARAPSGTTGMAVRRAASAGAGRPRRPRGRTHVSHGAVAQERHGAVRDLAQGLDLGPPAAAVAQADAVLVQGLGDDDVLDARRREPAFAGEVRDARRSRPTPRRPCRRSRWRRRSREGGDEASAATMEAASPPFMSQAPGRRCARP